MILSNINRNSLVNYFKSSRIVWVTMHNFKNHRDALKDIRGGRVKRGKWGQLVVCYGSKNSLI